MADDPTASRFLGSADSVEMTVQQSNVASPVPNWFGPRAASKCTNLRPSPFRVPSGRGCLSSWRGRIELLDRRIDSLKMWEREHISRGSRTALADPANSPGRRDRLQPGY